MKDPGIKTVHMVRTTVAPVIDGKLDDVAWQTAALVDNLHQVSPIEYAEPNERSEIYLLYDDEALYVGARLFDNMPEDITANILRQADNMGNDDRFYITIDPFNTKRSGYFFGLNPNGVRSDGLNRYFMLEAGSKLQVRLRAPLDAGKTLYVVGQAADF